MDSSPNRSSLNSSVDSSSLDSSLYSASKCQLNGSEETRKNGAPSSSSSAGLKLNLKRTKDNYVPLKRKSMKDSENGVIPSRTPRGEEEVRVSSTSSPSSFFFFLFFLTLSFSHLILSSFLPSIRLEEKISKNTFSMHQVQRSMLQKSNFSKRSEREVMVQSFKDFVEVN
jgi:hypothetical protein